MIKRLLNLLMFGCCQEVNLDVISFKEFFEATP
jgi:hypothetical protein